MENVKWIFDKNAKTNEWYVLKNNFHIDSSEDVFVDITSLGVYILYINGTLVSRGPVKSFDYCKAYDSVDISPFVQDGTNRITVFSHKIEDAGVFARVYTKDKVLTVTDRSWKIKHYEALLPDTLVLCPPLEPICRSEEHFDANRDRDVLSETCDCSQWQNAQYTDTCNNKIEKSLPYFPKNNIVMPKSIETVCGFRAKNGYGIRLVSDYREKNPVTKCAYEIYACEVNAERAFEAQIIRGAQIFVNGKNVGDKISFNQGKNLIVITYCSDANPEFFIITEEKLKFSKWYVYNLPSSLIYFGWNYDTNIFEGTDSAEFIEEITSKTAFSELGERFTANMKEARVCENSITYDNLRFEYGKMKNGFSRPDFKIPFDYEENSSDVSNPTAMLYANPSYTKVKGNAYFILDFGVEVLGHIQFKIWAKKGTVIDFEGFELANTNGIVHMRKNRMRYICRDGWQEFVSFLPRGFRYLGVHVGGGEEVKIAHIGLEDVSAAISQSGDFSCDNEYINTIYKMCINTVEACMSDTYVDCPGYEQVYWVGDAIVSALVNLNSFGDYQYDYRCLEITGKSMEEDYKNRYKSDNESYQDDKYLVIPAHGTYVEGGLPEFSFMWALAVYNYYMYSGDRDGMKVLFGYVKKMLDNCENMMSSRGLFVSDGAWNLIEWAENDLLMCGEVTASSVWLCKLYRVFAEVAEDFGESDLANKYLSLSDKLSDAVNKYCWNREAEGYCDSVRDEYGYNLYLEFFAKNNLTPVSYDVFKKYERISDQTNTICYLCDCVPEERMASVKKIICRVENPDYKYHHTTPRENAVKVNRGEYHGIDDITPIGSPFFLYYTLDALLRMGHTEAFFDVVKRSYMQMADKGSNTCWENFYNEKTDEYTRSICHGWGASPAVYMITDICGIKPTKPGFREFMFMPNLGPLTKVKATVPTPYGKIYVDIDTSKGKKDISYPKECKLKNE